MFKEDIFSPFAVPLCSYSKSLYSFDELKKRMTFIALEGGLAGGISNDSVEMLNLALDVR
jgi:hypothetical protein